MRKFEKHDADASTDAVVGWLEAGMFVIAVSALNVLYAYAVARGANVTVFVLYAMIGTSVAMLAASGIGEDAWAVIKAPQSWIFGGASVALEAIYFLLVGLISPAEASLTARLSVPASLLIAWLFFKARLGIGQIVGGAIVIAAVLPIFIWLPEERQPTAIVLGVLCALVVAIKTFASEYHPWNRKAASVREKVRVTGLVVLATTLLGLALTAVIMSAAAMGVGFAHDIAPPVSAFSHAATIALALVFGTAILVAMSYLTFSSVAKIGTSNFLATSAVTPLSAYALQSLAAGAGLIAWPTLGIAVLAPIMLGIIGVLLIVISGRNSAIRQN